MYDHIPMGGDVYQSRYSPLIATVDHTTRIGPNQYNVVYISQGVTYPPCDLEQFLALFTLAQYQGVYFNGEE